MRRNFILIAFIMFSLMLLNPVYADNTLRVGVYNLTPYAFQENGVFKGMAVDLWERVAKLNGWKYRYVMTEPHSPKLMQALAEKKLDVVIGSISVTYETMKSFDFSRTYLLNPTTVVFPERSTGFLNALGGIFNQLLYYKYHVLMAFVLFVIFINLLWWFEHGRKAQAIYKEKMKDIVWNAFLIVLTKQQVGKYQTWSGRFLVAVMILAALVVGGLMIAAFASALTLSLTPHVYKISDIENKPVAVTKNSFIEQLLKENGFQYISYPNRKAETNALVQKKVAGIAMFVPTARYYLREHNDLQLTIAPFVISYNELAFAFQLNSPYTRAFNLSLTYLQDAGDTKKICKTYLGEKEGTLCDL